MKTSSNYKVPGKDFDLILDLHRGSITVQQKWKYDWFPKAPSSKKVSAITKGLKPWTYAEKKAYHQSCDSTIWQWWGNKYKLQVEGTDDFSLKFKDKLLPLNFDLRWVTHGEHYKVCVSKERAFSRAGEGEYVQGNKIQLYVDSNEWTIHYTLPSGAESRKPQTMQKAVAHEFGHALGYDDDEYEMLSFNCNDVNSVMNSGWELRGRHIKSVMTALNSIALFPDTKFLISKRR